MLTRTAETLFGRHRRRHLRPSELAFRRFYPAEEGHAKARLVWLVVFLTLSLPAPGSEATGVSGFAADDIIEGSDQADRLQGDDDSDLLQGKAGDDELRGGAGDDELRGGDGDDVLVGGPGLDILYGGPGADQFVIDLIEQEVDEIMDFAPEEGDTLWIQPRRPVRGKKKISSSIGLGQVEVDYKRLTVDNVRLGYNGDVEFRFEGRGWEKIAGIKRSDLKLTVTQEGERLRLRFRRKF